MNKPSKYERVHWFIFNGGVKLFGLLLPIWSIVFLFSIIKDYFSGSNWYGFGAVATIVAALICVIFFTLGVLILRAKNYVPSQYKEYYDSLNNDR